MRATFLAVRAIGARYATQLWVISFIGALIISAILVALLVWLASQSAAWWLLSIPIGIAISVAAVLLIVFFLLIRYVRPPQTSTQKELITKFVDKLQFVSDFAGTPKFIILFRTIRSIAAPKSDTYLQDIFETKDLKKDFQTIVRSFTQ